MLATELRKQAKSLFYMSASTNLRTGTIMSYRRATEPAVRSSENIIPTSKNIYQKELRKPAEPSHTVKLGC